MSAFIVSKKHIDTLLTYGRRPQSNAPARYYWNGQMYYFDDMDKIGQALVNQNYASVNHRYSELDIPEEYTFKNVGAFVMPSPVQVIKACDCYHYQACETDNYKETEAYAIVEAIRERAIDNLPGYEEAAWEIV